jgi:hypothetical protein
MVYEARHSRGVNYALIGGVLLVSLIGFAAAGVIPTASGTSPAVGWVIVAACLAAAFLFFRRASDQDVQARIDQAGVYAPRFSSETVPWDRICGAYAMRAGIQRVARFDVRDPAGGSKTFGINTTFYDRGMAELLAAVRHHRPDLLP